jgi:hypothetical protein
VGKELNKQKQRSQNNKDNMDFDQLPGSKELREYPGERFRLLLPGFAPGKLEITKKRPEGTEKCEEDYRMCKNSHYVSRRETALSGSRCVPSGKPSEFGLTLREGTFAEGGESAGNGIPIYGKEFAGMQNSAPRPKRPGRAVDEY